VREREMGTQTKVRCRYPSREEKAPVKISFQESELQSTVCLGASKGAFTKASNKLAKKGKKRETRK